MPGARGTMEVVGSLAKIGISRGASIAAPRDEVRPTRLEDYRQALSGLDHLRAVEYAPDLLGATGGQSGATRTGGGRDTRSTAAADERGGTGVFAGYAADRFYQAVHRKHGL